MRGRRCVLAVAMVLALSAIGCSSSDESSTDDVSATVPATNSSTTTPDSGASTSAVTAGDAPTPTVTVAAPGTEPGQGSLIGPPTGPGSVLDQYGLDEQQNVCVQARVGPAGDPGVLPAEELEAIVQRCTEMGEPLEEFSERLVEVYPDDLTEDERTCISETAAELSVHELQLAILATEPVAGEPSGESTAVLVGLFAACGGFPGE